MENALFIKRNPKYCSLAVFVPSLLVWGKERKMPVCIVPGSLLGFFYVSALVILTVSLQD